MAHQAHTVRVTVASFIALALVVGAYSISGPIPFFSSSVDAQSVEELLREYAARDTDSDGLPDWQEALYGTDPENPYSAVAGVRDGDAVAQGLIQPRVATSSPETTDIDSIPGTVAPASSLTDRFARALFTQYMQNRGATAPTPAEMSAFVASAVQELSQTSFSSARYTASSVTVTANTPATFASYLTQAEAALAAHAVYGIENELVYFDRAMRGDKDALKQIAVIASVYQKSAESLIKVPVPSDAQQAHLAIANAMARMSETITYLAALDTDPLAAVMGLGMYTGQLDNLVLGFKNMGLVFDARQVSAIQGEPGFSFYQLTRASMTVSGQEQ